MQRVLSEDGTTIEYRKSGSGPPLLLVHGIMADRTRWEPISPRFEQHFTVYAMDRRGRGGSGDGSDYGIMREAEDVAAVADAMTEPVSVLAHSGGALYTLEGALLTENIRRMVLYEPPIPGVAPPIPVGIPERIQEMVDGGEQEAALEVFLREIVRMPEHELKHYRQLPAWKRRIPTAPTIPRELLIARTYRWNPDRFSGVEVPTLLLLGGDSPPFARQAVEMVHAALPNSEIVVLPGQQHIAMDTNPELFAREVCDFLRA